MAQINVSNLKHRIEWIDHRYNPENDTIPNTPSVTWTDKELLDIVNNILTMLDVLQNRITQLEHDLDISGLPRSTNEMYNEYMERRQQWKDYLDRKNNEDY